MSGSSTRREFVALHGLAAAGLFVPYNESAAGSAAAEQADKPAATLAPDEVMRKLLEGNRRGMVWGLILTIILGMMFTSLQAYEYLHAHFQFAGHIYGSTFFMATGFHGFHVIIGTIFLIVTLGRTLAGHFTEKQHFGFEAATWYWHFVDVVWLFLFVSIYVWGAGTPLPE